LNGHQGHHRLTDREALAGLHGKFWAPLATKKGAVGAAQILDADTTVFEVNLGVATRGLGVTEHDVTSLAADARHAGTNVAGLVGLVDVLNLENVVGRHWTASAVMGGEHPNWGHAAQAPVSSGADQTPGALAGGFLVCVSSGMRGSPLPQ
jgi:hypothetical protein